MHRYIGFIIGFILLVFAASFFMRFFWVFVLIYLIAVIAKIIKGMFFSSDSAHHKKHQNYDDYTYTSNQNQSYSTKGNSDIIEADYKVVEEEETH